MPLYDFICSEGHPFERIVPLANFSETQHCACSAPATRVISAPRFSVDQTDYTCPITGVWIGSKAAHRENLARHGCRVLETGETEAAAAYRRKQDEALDKAVEDSVEKSIEAMPSEKKEALHNELINGGLTAEVTRL